MEKEVKIYSFSYYNFTNNSTGEVVQGVKVFYVDPNSGLKDLSIDEVSSNFIYDQLMSGYKKITYKDIQFINEYRASRGLTLIDMKDIEDFISSVKDVLLVKN